MIFTACNSQQKEDTEARESHEKSGKEETAHRKI
jgi:hypothetical protein